jgi:hypothetical protein
VVIDDKERASDLQLAGAAARPSPDDTVRVVTGDLDLVVVSPVRDTTKGDSGGDGGEAHEALV